MPFWRGGSNHSRSSYASSDASSVDKSEVSEQELKPPPLPNAKAKPKPKLVVEKKYQTIATVLESWETALELPNFEEEAGAKVLLHLFALEPDTKENFGLRRRIDARYIKKSEAFNHAVKMLDFLDLALNLVGPPELLFLKLRDVGRRHEKYGVRPQHLPLMGKAVRLALEEVLPPEDWTPEVDKAWEDVLKLFIDHISRGMEK